MAIFKIYPVNNSILEQILPRKIDFMDLNGFLIIVRGLY